LYSETPTPVDQLFESKQLNVVREVQSELILSPLAAKELTIWLSEKINDFEKDFGVIPSPSNKSKSSKSPV
jgi:hypothetical protein